MNPSTRDRGDRFWLGLVCACAGALGCATTPEPGERSEKVKQLEELPDRYREVWQAFRREDPSWPQLREEVHGDPALCTFVVNNLVREMLLAFGHADLTRADDPATRHLRRTRAELVRYPEESSRVLAELLGVGNGSAVHLAADVLEEIGRPALEPVAAQLDSERVQARQWAARLLGELPNALDREDELIEALSRRARDDEDWLVRAQSAQALGKRGGSARETRGIREALTRALADPDPAVRLAAVKGLADLDDPDAVPALVEFLERAHAEGEVREYAAAEQSLRALTGARARMDINDWREWARTRK